MSRLFCVNWVDPVDNIHDFVGVYDSFDLVVEACDAHAAWYKRGESYLIQPLALNTNHNGDYRNFMLLKGMVPDHYCRKSKYNSRFKGGV